MTPEISIQISTTSVAWYGAIVATISAIVAILNMWRDQARVKVTFQKGLMIMNAIPPYSEDKTYFAVHITNKGRRPVAVGNIAVKYISGETFILASSLDNQETRIITEEKPHTMILTDEETIDLPKLSTILVYDLSGRKYVKYLTRFPTFRRAFNWLTNH
jgi:hypothetical protein